MFFNVIIISENLMGKPLAPHQGPGDARDAPLAIDLKL